VRCIFIRSIGALVALLMAFGSQAALVTVYGTDVKFTYEELTAFGTANVIGNNIFFLPTTFLAESLNGEGAVTNNVTLNIEVEAITDGYSMNAFQLAEEGDYKLNGTDASVSANGQFRITSLTKQCGAGTFAPICKDEQIFDAGPLTVNTNLPVAWSAGALIDLADTEFWDTDTKVTMTIENLLTATTTLANDETFPNGETAFIQKKFVGGGVGIIINPVPVPGAVWLFGSAIGLLGWVRRRRAA
jgi:hypothetical protein